VLDLDTLMAAITGAEGQHSRDIGRDLPLKTAVLHKRRCSTRAERQKCSEYTSGQAPDFVGVPRGEGL